jgi:hypothetical protein
VGEVRVEQAIAADTPGYQGQNDATAPQMELYLAISDPAWDHDGTLVEDGLKADRIYRLVVDPDPIVPAGSYGADGATGRIRGPGAWAPQATGDERSYEIHRADLFRFVEQPDVNDTNAERLVKRVEPDHDERQKLPFWGVLSDQPFPANPSKVALTSAQSKELRNLLWAAKKRRVACRFYLETIVRVRPEGGRDEDTFDLVSKRVALSVEQLIRTDIAGGNVASLRPEALELAAPLALPPLAPNQIQVRTGFLCHLAPKVKAAFADWVSGAAGQAQWVRDAERRLLTSVSFAAVPEWARKTSNVAGLNPLHGSTIAGFDVYELDLDEAAPLDEVNLSLNAAGWEGVRRVARVEQIAPEMAQLLPSGHADLRSFRASYPSETLRLEGATNGALRSPWYSAAETTPHFAERRPRLRFFPLPPEEIIPQLLQNGRPSALVVNWLVASGSKAAEAGLPGPLPGFRLHPVSVTDEKGHNPAQIKDAYTIVGDKLQRGDKAPLEPSDVRNLLLCLGWAPFASDSEVLTNWQQDPGVFDGLGLSLTAAGGADASVVLARTEAQLSLRSPIHPILEETLAELALWARAPEGSEGPSVYRALTVMAQPCEPSQAKDLASFMGSTQTETDPYGWGVLQVLGMARAVRLYDAARDCFLQPDELGVNVNAVFSQVLARWKAAHKDEKMPAILGQPFVEVFLQPGRDRGTGPYDAVLKTGLEGPAGALEMRDDGLAFVQLALRPRPVPVWTYRALRLEWNDAWTFIDEKLKQGAGSGRIVGIYLEATRGTADLELALEPIGATGEVTSVAPEAVLQLPLPSRRVEGGQGFTLLVRSPEKWTENVAVRLRVRLDLEFLIDGQATKGQPIEHAVGSISALLKLTASEDCPEPVELQRAAQPKDQAFGRFGAQSAETWSRAFGGPGSGGLLAAREAFLSLKSAIAGAGLTDISFPAETAYPQVVGTYLTWAQRFLDHCAPRAAMTDPASARFAIAAPEAMTPWRLAPDREGFINLDLPNADRLGNVRAFAVKPVGRYHHLLAGIDVAAEKEFAELLVRQNEQKVWKFAGGRADPIGVAVAVTPRTERLEPPVILGSSLVNWGQDDAAAQVVLGRHAEDALGQANRKLRARLGAPTSLVSFGRSYRTPKWPSRLTKAFNIKTPITLPGREPQAVARPAPDLHQITDDLAGEIGREYPAIVKGADVWRVEPVPPHYSLVMLASMRAGLVVSDVSAVMQDRMPRRSLAVPEGERKFSPGSAVLDLARTGGDRVQIDLRWPLISHKDLTPDDARPWITDDDWDVAYWPDPDVVYVLSRSHGQGEDAVYEEDAEVRLVAVEADANAAPQPVVVRARGTRLQAVSDPAPKIVHEQAARVFRVAMSLATTQDVQKIRLVDPGDGTGPEWKNDAAIADFNTKAKAFAAILSARTLQVDLPPRGAEKGAAYIGRVRKLRDAVVSTAAGLGAASWGIWFAATLRTEADRLNTWLASANSSATAKALYGSVGLPMRLAFDWPKGATEPTWTGAVEADLDPPAFETDPGEPILVVWDLATSQEIADIKDVAPISSPSGRLRALLRTRLLGQAATFAVKAVDGRAPPNIDSQGVLGAPSAVSIDVTLPTWLN